MRARIFQPTPNAMQSGRAKGDVWVLEFARDASAIVDPLMGWTGSDGAQTQVRLTFDSKQAALEYASDKGIDCSVATPNLRKPNIRAGGYGDNFATNRRAVWTH